MQQNPPSVVYYYILHDLIIITHTLTYKQQFNVAAGQGGAITTALFSMQLDILIYNNASYFTG